MLVPGRGEVLRRCGGLRLRVGLGVGPLLVVRVLPVRRSWKQEEHSFVSGHSVDKDQLGQAGGAVRAGVTGPPSLWTRRATLQSEWSPLLMSGPLPFPSLPCPLAVAMGDGGALAFYKYEGGDAVPGRPGQSLGNANHAFEVKGRERSLDWSRA